MEVNYKIAAVHGRFQPPHYGHLEYILAAKNQCDYLWIGVTQYIVSELPRAADSHRSTLQNNPLTYFERVDLITTMLEGAGVSRSAFGFIPFPIEQPQLLKEFLPTSITCFTTVYDEWNKEKIKRLEEQGYLVRILWERPDSQKIFRGQAVRQLLRASDDSWKIQVPPSIHYALIKLNIAAR